MSHSLSNSMAVTDILNKLQEYNNSNLVEAYVPSMQGVAKFKQLSVKQQKDLIKTALDGAMSGLTLNNIINNIIVSNSVIKHNFLVTDKLPIIMALRVAAMGTKYINENDVQLDLSIINNNTLTFTADNTAVIDHEDVIKVSVSVPSIMDDIKINETHHNELKKKESEVSDLLGSFYVYEIAKFIQSVEIGEDVIDFNKLKLNEKVQIVENLSAKLNSKIIEFIQQFRQAENTYMTIDDVQISVDARLFS
jgi:hypothetical protein